MNKLLAFSIVALMIISCANHEKHLLLDVREVDYRIPCTVVNGCLQFLNSFYL